MSATISLFILRTQSAYVFYYAICVLGLTTLIAMYKEPYVTRIRKRLSDLASEYTRYLVRVLMSKFEILSTGRFERETERLYKIRDEFIGLRKKENDIYFMILDFP